MRVFVRHDSAKLAAHYRANFRRSMRMLAVILPSSGLVLLLIFVGLSEDYRSGDRAQFWFAMAFTIVLIGGLTLMYMRWNRSRRLALVGNPIWVSPFAMYMGPHGERGLPGSADWASRHSRNTPTPIVVLVLTADTFEIIPWLGRREKLVLRLNDVESVDIVFADRKQRGISIRAKSGAQVDLSLKPDTRLAEHLAALGAEVIPAPPSPSASPGPATPTDS